MALASLVFELDRHAAEPLADLLLDLGALSVGTEDAAAGTEAEEVIFDEPGESASWQRLRLRVLVDAEANPLELIKRACAGAGVTVPDDVVIEPVGERDWVRASQASFDPVRISARLWVVPSWHVPPDPLALVVRLDPGAAFGTGSHPTTRLCLQWLERQLRGGESVLDYGCGSGILAIAAKKLGAGMAYGVDIDPAAVNAARENAERNGVGCEFLLEGPPCGFRTDIIVANILANPLKLLAPVLAGYLPSGGRIALSGILERQQREVENCYAQWFDFEPPARAEGWVCLSGKRIASRHLPR